MPYFPTRIRKRHLLVLTAMGLLETPYRPNSHMGIYIGNDQFINAPSSGGRVRIDSMQNPYFAKL